MILKKDLRGDEQNKSSKHFFKYQERQTFKLTLKYGSNLECAGLTNTFLSEKQNYLIENVMSKHINFPQVQKI